MSDQINSLLLTVASQYVLEADTWERTHGSEAASNPDTTKPSGRYWDEDDSLSVGPNGEREEYSVADLHYKKVMEDTVETFDRIAPQLAALGHNTYKVTIQGSAGGDIDHYDMDLLVQEKFGDRVTTDSESGRFFCYCGPDDTDEILAFVQEIGGQNSGEQWTTYGGSTGTASFSASEDDEWSILGLENWTSARIMVKVLQAMAA